MSQLEKTEMEDWEEIGEALKQLDRDIIRSDGDGLLPLRSVFLGLPLFF